MARTRNPLEPAGSVLGALLTVTGVGLAIALLLTVLGPGSIMGIGRHATVYVDLRDYLGASNPPLGRWQPRSGTAVDLLGYQFRALHPDLAQRFWFTLTLLPGAVLFVGALVLGYQTIRGAERGGIYTPATARRLRTLGWFLLAGGVARTLVPAMATNRLLATMVDNSVAWIDPTAWDPPWAVLLISAGLLTFARITRVGAEMQDELQGTV